MVSKEFFLPVVADLLDFLQTKGESLINEWFLYEKDEDLHLEFKSKSDLSKPKLSNDDKQNIGKTLSGFSNAEGGIVVWGIATKKNEHGIDKISELKPLKEIDTALELFKNQHATSIAPENSNVQIFAIKCSYDQTIGYIIVGIPKGPSRPYMSLAPGHQKYFRRTILGSQPLEHYEIVDLLRSEVSPLLKPIWNITHWNKNGRGDDTLQLKLILINKGNVAAKQPYLWIEPPFNDFSIEKNERVEKKDTRGIDNKIKFLSSAMYILFPDDFVEFCSMDITILGGQVGSINCSWGTGRGLEEDNNRRQFQDQELSLWIGAENCPKTETVLRLSKKEVEEKCKNICGYN
jgi:Putative DNA-binding domain